MTPFFRVLDTIPDEKSVVLLARIKAFARGDNQEAPGPRNTFLRDPESFSVIPGSPFAYWVSDRLAATFRTLPRFEGSERTAKCGMGTLDDFRFLRSRHEVSTHPDNAVVGERRWVDYVGPRKRALAYSALDLVVNWKDNGRELKTFVEQRVGSASRKIQSEGYYFRSGLAWPLRGSRFSTQAVPVGCTFSVAGKMAFVPESERLFFLGLFNSSVFDSLIGLFAGKVGGVQYEAGLIQSIPVPDTTEVPGYGLSELARRAWSLKHRLDTTNETSHAFVLPPGTVGYEASPFHCEAGGFNRADIQRELAEIQTRIDDKVFALYGISEEDRGTIEASMTRGAGSPSTDDGTEPESSDDADDSDDSDDDESEAIAELTSTTLTTYSWLVGVAFGRFDPRLATGKRPIPPEPEPFDPLPARSPGMMPEGETSDTVYPDIMVDDPGHDYDLRALVANAAAKTGWPAPDDLRQWLAKEFFPLHIKMYSKSRRKAPIYWQLATPTASYSVWLYLHAFTKDTLFRVQNDYVAPKLAHELRKLESLQAASADGQTAADRKELGNQESLVEELRGFLDEVKRVAPLWNPDLDDGVIINFSLLWRLVPQHKVWQKELKTTWDALCVGDYDWAHLAMHLWPERVVPKCAADRSLAIAHCLEEVFWVESDGKWTARKTPSKPIAELVRERTSPAVHDALKQLLNAPTANAGGVKRKAPREASARAVKPPKTAAGKV